MMFISFLFSKFHQLIYVNGNHSHFFVFFFLQGIFVGDGKIIHFTRAAGQETGTGTALDNLFVSSSPANSSGIPCEICGDQSMLQGVLKSCIDCFLAGGNLHLFQYSVSTALFIAQARGGTCTLAHSDPSVEVLHRANYLKENGFGAYCIFKNNCEDFAIYCKTGLLVNTKVSVGLSGQLSSFLAVTSTVISTPLRMLTTSFGGLTVMASGVYCFNRYLSDIGIRRDVTKVAVETMVERMVEKRDVNKPAEMATPTTI